MVTTQTAPPAPPRAYLLWPAVMVGVAAISFASILIRLAGTPAMTTAAYRVTLAALAMGPPYAFKHRKGRGGGRLPRGIVLATTLSGCFLALHFGFWIVSLQLTSIASSVSLVSTTPLFIALFSYSWLRQKPTRRFALAVLCTTIGSVFVAGIDFAFSARALWGDLLAVMGAAMAAGYLMAGQVARRSMDLTSYSFGAYGAAALTLLAGCLFTGSPLSGFSRQTYLVLILLALVPQLIGHTTFNWTLRFLPSSAVSILILGEPIGATFLGYVFFGEAVAGLKAVGLAILGFGIVLGSVSLHGGAPRVQVDSRQEKQ